MKTSLNEGTDENNFRIIVEQSPMAIGLLHGRDMVVETANPAILEAWGKDASIIGLPIIQALPEIKDQPFMNLLLQVFDSGVPYNAYSAPATLIRKGKTETVYFDYVYTPTRDDKGTVTGIMVLATNVTEQVSSRQRIEENEARFRSLIEQASFASCLFIGKDMIVQVANKIMLGYWGKDETAIGLPLAVAVPELRGQPFLDLLDNVFTTGKTHKATEQPAQLLVDGTLDTFYFDYTYEALRNATGEIYGVINTSINVTEKVLARKKLEESELYVRSIFYNSPVAKMVFTGPDMVISTINENMIDMLGHGDEVIGKPFMESMPELIPTPLMSRLQRVRATGEPFFQPEEKISFLKYGLPHTGYYTYIYKPLYNTTGEINGIMCTCTEVTEQVTARQEKTEAERLLRDTIEAAELATWDLNPVTGKFTGNDRIKEWFGLQPKDEIELELAVSAMAEKDRNRVAAAIQRAMEFSSGGLYEIEYSIENAVTGQKRIVKAKGKALFDEHKQPYRFNGTLQDITAEVLGKEQQQKLLTLVDNSVDLMSILDLDGTNSYINKAGRDILGIDHDADVTIIPISDYHTKEQIVFVESEIIPTVMGKGRWAGQFAIRNGKTGEIIPLYNNCHRINDVHTGEPIGVGAVMRDMRPELSAQRDRIANEERLNIAIDTTELGMWELDMISGNLTYNQRYLTILGFEKGTNPPHEEVKKRIHPDDLDMRNNAVKASLDTGSMDFEVRIIYSDQSIHWIKAKGKIFKDSSGVPFKQLGTIQDITDQKNSLEAYKLSLDRFRLLADFMPQFIWTGDVSGNLNYYSQAVYDYSGLSPEKIAEEGWLQIVHPEDRDENVRLWIESVTTGSGFFFEHRFRRHDGEYRWQLSRALPQRDEEGNIRMWVGTSTDIHDQKIMSQELEQKVIERTKALQEVNDELEKKNRDLASFAYVSSHDLQEPLRKINTFISRIEDPGTGILADKHKDYFGRIKKSSGRMQLLIRDLLSFSRTSSSEQEYEKADLTMIVNEVTNDLAETIERTGAVITLDNLPVLNVIVFQMYQLFENLISNAVKFSKTETPPVIKITGELLEGKYHITVSDNGIGFEEEYSERIFEVFQRLHGRNDYEGTGIGLAICKKIVENHAGYIKAESTVGKGSRFHIYLPV